jgi:signal peptidase I
MIANAHTVRSWLWAELPQLLLVLLLVLVARSTLADHYFVPSGSMEYTLMPGDRVFVNKAAYGIRIPFTDVELIAREPVGRGEIAIFDSPRDGTRLIKRIVAVAGDRVSLRDGLLRINGNALNNGVLDDSRVIELFGERSALLNLQHGGGPGIAVTVIPEGMVLAVGDHRGRSLDGRVFGLVPEAAVYGRAVAVYYRRGDGFVWLNL